MTLSTLNYEKNMSDGKTALALSANLSLTKEDIITIKISEIEESAELEIERLNMHNKELEKRAQAVRVEKETTIAGFIAPIKAAAGKAEADLLATMFNDVKVATSVENVDASDSNKAGFLFVTTMRGGRKNAVPERIARNSRHSGSVDEAQVTLHKFVETPAEILAFDEKIKDIQAQILDTNEKIFGQKKILAQLPRTARRATAALAKAMLTNGGEANNMLLETLQGVAASGVKRIG